MHARRSDKMSGQKRAPAFVSSEGASAGSNEDYAKRYSNLVRKSSQVIWWKLFNASCSRRWSNVLSLIELLFCIPVSNGHVERVFKTYQIQSLKQFE